MFKYFYSILLTGLSGLALLTGCDDPEPKTRLDFVAGTGLTSENRTVAGGEIITTSLFARSASAGNNLKKFIVSRVYDTLINPSVVVLDSTFDAGEFGMTFVFGSRPFQNGQTQGKEYWTFKVVDAQGQEYQKQYTLETTFNNANPNFNSFTSAYFYRNARENIRYVSTGTGGAYPGYVIQNNPGLQADLDFYFGHEPPLTVNLSALNGTRFKATNLTATEFNGANTAANLSGFYENAGAESDQLTAVQPNSVIAFKTGKDKIGLIQIGTFEISRDSLQHANVLRRVPYNVKVVKK